MFDNIGSKIKALAKTVFIIMAVIWAISGFSFMFILGGGVAILLGPLIGGIGILLSWIGTFFLYGFGQLIENSDILVKEAKKQSNGIQRISTDNNSNNTDLNSKNTTVGASKFEQTTRPVNFAQSSTTATNFKRCPHCGERVTSKSCDVCGRENNLF